MWSVLSSVARVDHKLTVVDAFFHIYIIKRLKQQDHTHISADLSRESYISDSLEISG